MKQLHLSIACLAILLSACSKETPPPEPPPRPEVGVRTLKPGHVALATELPGRTVESLVSEVRPQVGGVVRDRLFTEGARVKAGQVLYRIEPATYRAAIEEAQAALQVAEASVPAARAKSERYADLVEAEGVSRQDAEDSQGAYAQALATVAQRKAALSSARISLGFTEIRAPISGRIGKSSVTPGALVTASQDSALATIRALDPIYVDISQSSASILKLRAAMAAGNLDQPGLAVRLKLEDGSAYAHEGLLKFSEVAVDSATGAVTLRAEFPNPEGTLLPGMYVRAVVEEAVNPQGVLAPQQGISRNPKGQATALVVNPQSEVEPRIVETSRTVGDQWLVASGLAAGDRVIVEGSSKVKPGMKVRGIEVADRAPVPASASAPTPASSGGR